MSPFLRLQVERHESVHGFMSVGKFLHGRSIGVSHKCRPAA
jgi:hypothetical protein